MEPCSEEHCARCKSAVILSSLALVPSDETTLAINDKTLNGIWKT